ncbi:BTB/POZ domain-containing protein POB1 [Acorus gramineus]|uniref:BTB/POZ domain-containing protein POB1 n=1 Tax=Acorus gramineus TaxID=55184 RepID=A0AAV9ALG3_ACOGR|nr:BTB/POZ domain-containing protein POB1 [Acorus gramineus]
MTFIEIEGVFGGEKLWASEDEVFEIVLKWARNHFPALQKRQKRLGFYITRLVRFPFMTLRKLREVLMCEDLNREFAKRVVNEALFFKADPLHCNGALNNERQFIARTYMKRIVFYDLQLEKCKKLKGGETLYSETYLLGKQTFSLRMEHHNESNSFALYLDMRDTSLAPIKVVCEISAKLKPQMSFTEQFKFEKQYNVNQTRWGFHNMTDILWESFTSDHSRYFIDGILHLRAELYIVE